MIRELALDVGPSPSCSTPAMRWRSRYSALVTTQPPPNASVLRKAVGGYLRLTVEATNEATAAS